MRRRWPSSASRATVSRRCAWTPTCRSCRCSTGTTSGSRCRPSRSVSRCSPRWSHGSPPADPGSGGGESSVLGYTPHPVPRGQTHLKQSSDPGDAPSARTVALVFPGQGSQYVGMGADLVTRSPAAAAAYERADAALGVPLSRMILEGPSDELDLTVNAQPAILATSVAFLDAMREEAAAAGVEIVPRALAGHSAGQYAAAVAADAIDYADALRLVRERGRIMQERGIEGGMGAVIGLSDEQVR